ncbi:MAG TPA: phenylacetate--CoA ligase [Candidatus Deferrimicrobiaceae bacterium]|jgi:phenylacetate-CoA ligase
MIWNDEFETLPREALQALQLKRLRAMVDRVFSAVPFYRAKLSDAGYAPGSIRSLSDLSALPFTTKEDLRVTYPFGLFAEPLERVVRVHASSGTTGKPVVVGYTKRDIDTWAELMARTLSCGHATRKDIIQVAYGYGLFTGGLGAHYGAEMLGGTVIPMSGGNNKRQIMLMQDFGSTVLMSTPSYALNLAELMTDDGIDPATLALRVGFFGAEPWSEAMRLEIEKKLKIDAIDIYGLSEVMGPGVASECLEEKHGLHVFEDHFIPEVIDPATGKVLPWGETGELVFTTVTKEAFPVIRYRTRDISRLIPEPCRCGRTHMRMERVSGRTDDMLIIRGVNVFPSQIESVLMAVEGVEPHYQLIVSREEALDVLEVQVEIDESIFSDKVKSLEGLSKRVEHTIKDLLGISCKVKLVEPKAIQRSEGKAKRVIDNRKL